MDTLSTFLTDLSKEEQKEIMLSSMVLHVSVVRYISECLVKVSGYLRFLALLSPLLALRTTLLM